MTKTLRLTWHQVVARRLARHSLASPPKKAAPADIASAICGTHAQILSAAELSIGLRATNLTRTNIQQALWIDHSLIKTFGPRGTVHLLAAEDLPMWTGALSSLPQGKVSLPPGMAMTSEQTEAVLAAIAGALDDAELTVDELGDVVVARTGPWAGDLVMPAFQTYWPRWRQAIDIAAHRGVLCFGPNRGRNVTHTNPRRWLPKFKPQKGNLAVGELLKRYLHAYGPATPQQFAQWLAASPRWAIELFDSLSAELQPVELNGSIAWLAKNDAKFPSVKAKGVRLLPYFDAYVVGSHPRELVYPSRAKERAMARGQAGNYPVLLIDGIVGGVWHLRRAGRKLAITVEPLNPLSKVQRSDLDDEVERIGRFLEAKPELTIGKVSVGAHA